MDYTKAFNILEIDEYNTITLEYLKKKYHKLALINHPDKNDNTIESTEKFKQINEAYNYLKREIRHLNRNHSKNNSNKFSDSDKDKDSDLDSEDSSIYTNLLNVFIKSIFHGKYNDIILKIIKNIVNNCSEITKNISLTLFDELDKDTCLHIYSFLSKHRSEFHLSQEILDNVKQKILDKCDNILVYNLNPNINDLFENNVYKLYIDEQLFLVPLWHSEIYFDGIGVNEGKEIIVLCEPQLPKNIQIDENNNIYINIEITFDEASKSILNNTNKIVEIGGQTFEIPFSELFMKKIQYYKMKGKGLSKIKDDIYDVSEKDDILFKISIQL